MTMAPAPVSYTPIKPCNNICPSNLSHAPTTNQDENKTLNPTTLEKNEASWKLEYTAGVKEFTAWFEI